VNKFDLTKDLDEHVNDLASGTSAFQGVHDNVFQLITERGLPSATRPTDYSGEDPRDTNLLTDDQLGDLLECINRWLGWLEYELVIAENNLRTAEANYEFVQARLRVSLRNSAATAKKKLTIPAAQDYVVTDVRLLAAQQDVLVKKGIHNYVAAARNRAKRNWETVSRRITQRGQDVDRQKRTGSARAPSFPGQRWAPTSR